MLRAIFYRRQWDTLQDVYTKHYFFNVYEMFIVEEVVKKVFKRLRLESPMVYIATSLAGRDYNSRRKQKGLLPCTYIKLVLKQRSLSNVLRKAYKWLSLLNLIPPELRNFTSIQVKTIVRNINEVYVIGNREPF